MGSRVMHYDIHLSDGGVCMDAERKYAIRRPFGSYAVIPYGILMTGLMVMLFIRTNLSSSLFPIILLGFAVAVHMTWFIIAVIQLVLFKPRHLQLLDNAIALYNKEIRPADIEKIIVQGYFNPSIGILPMGKRFVPTDQCFAFREHDASFKALKEWASLNQVEVKAGHYRTWM